MAQQSGAAFTRRTFIGVAGGVAASTLLAACSRGGGNTGGGGGGGKALKFWNMPWGGTTFAPTDKKIATGWKGADGITSVTYQNVPWANFTQTFSSAVASNTGPAVSSGGGTQAFLFESQGKIAYADDAIASWESNGLKDDFLPGLLDTMKVKNGYAAVPYNLDMRVLWYNEQLFQQVGAEVPTDWQSYLATCETLKKAGLYGFGVAAGAGAYTGGHILVGLMINNGGGLFDENNQPNVVTQENIDAINFVLECVQKGYVDPGSVQYTSDNGQTQWKNKKFAMGWEGAGNAAAIGGDVGAAMKIVSPLKSDSGKQGMLYFPNNIMMYKNTPSQKASNDFLTYYYQNMKTLWTQKTGIGLPPLKSITQTSEFQSDPNQVKIINEYQPISKTWAAPGSDALFLGVTTVDGTPIMDTFAQSIYGGKTDAKSALTTLQNGIKDSLAKLKS